GVGRADVWVFDVDHLGSSVGGDALTIITLFTDTPRALAVSPDGATVYAAGFLTGNQTTALNEVLVQKAIENSDRIYPGPLVNHAGIPQPQVGLIVKYDGSHWVDELGQVWDDLVPFHLPDTDVLAIDAVTDPPVPISGADGAFSSVGTVLFNMIVNPASGTMYVSNTEAFNHVRFEGPGQFAGSTVRGHLHESRITILNGPGLPRVAPRHLNKHIDYSQCCDPIPNDENTRSLASPQHMAVTDDGSTLYVAGFGSSKVGIYDTTALESDRFVPSVDNQIVVTGGGPSGVVLDEARGHLYVMTRFDNGISTIDLATKAETGHLRMPNPEPDHIVKGRPFLYDASLTSSHGDSSCSSCHVFSDFDGLAWDLGDPDADEIINPGPFLVPPEVGFFLLKGEAEFPHFRPMKGPMTTQSLRGLANHGSMHWRGDRTGGNDEPNAQPDGGAFNEDLAFRKFNVAFVGLNGRDSMLSPEQMQAFADFNLEVTYPPNPIRHLDNSLTPLQQIGHDFFLGDTVSDTFFTCNGCHVLDAAGNGEFEVKHPGFFGTDGQFSFEGESQFFKIPHLRNMYQKVGMFGMAPLSEEDASGLPLGTLRFLDLANTGFMGDQIRGFGFLHDGSVDTLFRFVSTVTFLPRAPGTIPSLDPRTPPELVPDPGNEGIPLSPEGDAIRRGLEAFMLAFDSNMAP
ncbi:MAG: hypothetical protein OEU26_36795, partial [Candidatus Tectomicrobia bacterium]|nr:hypothetical protein [Candidatus Tectomicrobia bacterium]